jgi:hypothetical protein
MCQLWCGRVTYSNLLRERSAAKHDALERRMVAWENMLAISGSEMVDAVFAYSCLYCAPCLATYECTVFIGPG